MRTLPGARRSLVKGTLLRSCGTTRFWVTQSTADGSSLGAVCVDTATGTILYQVTVFEPEDVDEIHGDNTYASPTPVIEAGRLYVHYGRYGTACIDTQTGDVLWRNTSLVIDHQGGPGSSPVAWGDVLIVPCDGADEQYVVALLKTTGDVAWKTGRSGAFRENPIYRRAFSSPLLVAHDGQDQVICPGADQAQAYDPATGTELWRIGYMGFSNVPAPVCDGTRVFVCTGFYTPELWAIELGGAGNVTASHLRWKAKGAVPEVPSPIVVGNRVYLVSNKGVATCYDAVTGDRVWMKHSVATSPHRRCQTARTCTSARRMERQLWCQWVTRPSSSRRMDYPVRSRPRPQCSETR